MLRVFIRAFEKVKECIQGVHNETVAGRLDF